jgi:branched-chain amino acid transport system permease protein
MSTVNGPTLQPDPQAEQDELSRESRQRSGAVSRWNMLSRPAQWSVLLPVIVLAYAAPALNLPILSTETAGGGGTNWNINLFQMSYYALIAVGLNVVVGYAGLLDLGYVAFFAVGSYVAAMFTSPDSPFYHIPYLWTLPLAMAVTMFFGVMLATIIPAVKGQVGFQNVGRPPGTTVGENGVAHPLFSASNGAPWYWLTITIIIVVLLLVGNLERSRVGRAWVAIREDEDAAEIMGVPVFKFKVWAFAIGARSAA